MQLRDPGTADVLAGLLFAPDGQRMIHSYTRKKNGRCYRYYVPQMHKRHAAGTQRNANAPNLGHLPAADLENAVLAQVHAALAAPEVLVGSLQGELVEADDRPDEAGVVDAGGASGSVGQPVSDPARTNTPAIDVALRRPRFIQIPMSVFAPLSSPPNGREVLKLRQTTSAFNERSPTPLPNLRTGDLVEMAWGWPYFVRIPGFREFESCRSRVIVVRMGRAQTSVPGNSAPIRCFHSEASEPRKRRPSIWILMA